MLLLYTPASQRKMPCFAEYRDSSGTDQLLNGLRNLFRQTLLNLQPSRENIHDARNLAEPDHSGFGQVRHVVSRAE